jgi:signal transduction histidine kinase
MTYEHPVSGQTRDQFYLENLSRLSSYRAHDEVLSEALSLLINLFRASGGSVLYVSTLSHSARQGELSGAALAWIERWDSALRDRLRARTRQVQLPSFAPATQRILPGQEGAVVFIPLIIHERVCGSITLALPTEHDLDHHDEQALGIFATGVCAVVDHLEQLNLARQRLSQLGLFYQMGRTMSSTFDLERLFQSTIDLAISVVDAQGAMLMLLDREQKDLVCQVSRGGTRSIHAQRVCIGRGIAGWAAQHGQPVLVNDPSTDARFDPEIDGFLEHPTSAVLCVPLKIKGSVIGVIEAVNKASFSAFDAEDASVLNTLAGETAIALDNARLYHALRTERDRIIEAQESVRRELARNLHDGPVQLLASLAMGLDYLERVIQVEPGRAIEELDALRKMARRASQDARTLLFTLRPVILETQGLVPAFQTYIERLDASERFTPHLDTGALLHEPDVRTAAVIFSIVQEAVTNIQKHAHATNVWIRLREEESELVVSVEDDGMGFDIESVEANYDQRDSFGLLNMRERAELIDGVLRLESGPQRNAPGTLIELRVRLPEGERPKNGTSSDASRDREHE